MTTNDRNELLQLLDGLDEDAVGELLDYAHWLVAEEDEPLEPVELARVHQGEAEIARGEYVTLDDLRRTLSL